MGAKLRFNTRGKEWMVQVTSFVPVRVLDKVVQYNLDRSGIMRHALLDAVLEFENEHGIADPDNAGVA